MAVGISLLLTALLFTATFSLGGLRVALLLSFLLVGVLIVSARGRRIAPGTLGFPRSGILPLAGSSRLSRLPFLFSLGISRAPLLAGFPFAILLFAIFTSAPPGLARSLFAALAFAIFTRFALRAALALPLLLSLSLLAKVGRTQHADFQPLRLRHVRLGLSIVERGGPILQNVARLEIKLLRSRGHPADVLARLFLLEKIAAHDLLASHFTQNHNIRQHEVGIARFDLNRERHIHRHIELLNELAFIIRGGQDAHFRRVVGGDGNAVFRRESARVAFRGFVPQHVALEFRRAAILFQGECELGIGLVSLGRHG